MAYTNRPWVGDLEAGKHAICSCGESNSPPFCDGSHKGSGKAPAVIEMPETTQTALCQCSRSGNAPYCDGSHSNA